MYYSYFGFDHGWVLFPILVWTLVWKGVALWKSARLGHKWWFVAFLIINTLGILEIAYIYFFFKKVRAHHEHHEHHHA